MLYFDLLTILFCFIIGAGSSGSMVMVLYPEDGISEVQKSLMTAATGTNVHVVGKLI